MAKKLTIIDGNSLLYRAYFATASPGVEIMSTKDGIHTNALFAFANMMSKILSNMNKDESIFVAFDAEKKNFRHEQLETYKANRKPAPPELVEQFPLVRDFLKALNIFEFEEPGYEADDIAGTVAKLAGKEGYEVIIYTSDKDYLQLVDNNITVNLIKKGLKDINIMTPETVKEEFGFTPIQIIDYKGLRGDPSDNLPGIPGVGDKTAVKLIQEYGSLEKIIEASEEMTSKVGESIRNNKDIGMLCKNLAIIKIDTPINFTINDTKYSGYNFQEINKFAQRYELRQFMNKIPQKWKQADVLNASFEVEEIESLKGIDVPDIIGLAIDLDNEEYYYESDIYGFALSINDKNYYISYENALKDPRFKEILENNDIKKCGYYFKSIEVALANDGIKLNGQYIDIFLAAYLIDASMSTSKPEHVMAIFGQDLSGDDVEVSLLDPKKMKRTAKVARASFYLKDKVVRELTEINALQLFFDIEMPLSHVLASMEYEGFPLDSEVLDKFGDEFKIKAKALEKEIYDLAGKEFNISSPKQLGVVLFDDLKLPNNKGGSTSLEALKTIQDKHPIVDKILEYRKYTKLISTYCDGLKVHIHKDKKIHALFNQALTTTGRLSSSNPNLQNISIRDEEAKQIRKAFYYDDEDIEILSLDYSQIELRVLSALSNCKGMLKAFNEHEDIHSSTARAVFHVEEPTPAERRKAKAVNFGIVYGISDFGLSEQIGVSFFEAKTIINSFFEAYPEITTFLKGIVENLQTDGYVSTVFGRRRYLREIHDTNYQVREFAKRAAMNAPIQGTAADLIKMAMIKVFAALEEGGYKSKMVLQIHDELIFKVYKEEKDDIYKLVKNIMENIYDLGVNLEVDGGFGKTWFDCK